MAERLFRSRRERVIAGVAGGLAERWDADPSIIRIIWVVLTPLTGGLALIVYVVMALVVPDRDGDDRTASYRPAAGAGPVGWTAPGTATPDDVSSRSAADAGTTADRPAPRPFGRDRGRRPDGRGGGLILGILLILTGGYFLVRPYLPEIDFGLVWPIAAVVVGAVLVVLSVRPSRPDG